MKEIFCDGVAHVILSRGLVTIDFFHLVYEDDGHKPVPFLTLTIPVRGVLDMLDLGGRVVDHMTRIGMLVSNSGNPVPAEEKKAPAKPAAKPAPVKKAAKSSPAPAKKAAPVPAKKADAKPAAKPAPAKAAPAPAKKADAKPAVKPAPAKKPAPAPAKKADAKPAKKSAKGKKPAK